MNPAEPNFRTVLEDLNRPAFQIMPVSMPAADDMPAKVARNLPFKRVAQAVDEAVALAYGVTPAVIHSRCRVASIAGARQVAMFVTRQLTGASGADLGRYYDRRSGVVSYNCCVVQDNVELYRPWRVIVEEVRNRALAAIS